MDLTLLELHLENAEFNAPFAGRRAGGDDGEPTSTGETAADAGDEPGGQGGLGLAAVLLGAVGVALLARYLRGGADEQTTLDELEA